MPFEEKMTWLSVVVGVLVPTTYFAIVLPQLSDTPASQIVYQPVLVISVVAFVVLMIIGAILTAVATAARTKITGVGSVDEIDRKDERDVQIGRRGDVASYFVASTGVVIALIITMLEYDYFWIANVLYLSFAVAAVTGGVVKLRAYRRGF